jgi:alpha-L-rhamnosidase
MPYWLIKNETFTCFPIVTANQPPLPLVSGGSWIWFPEGSPSLSAPAGTRYFRRRFIIGDVTNLKDAALTLSADNLSTVYINGKLAGRSLKWQTPLTIQTAPFLKSGVNTIAIEATNIGDTPSPAGLIADLQLDYKHGEPVDVVTDLSWKTTNRVYPGWEHEGFDDGNWTAPISMGPYGMAPWGQIYGVR